MNLKQYKKPGDSISVYSANKIISAVKMRKGKNDKFIADIKGNQE